MHSLIRRMAIPLISLILLMLGNGFFITFVSVKLDDAGATNGMIGLITAAFYAGMLLVSFWAPSWIAKFGHLRVWIGLCGANGVLILLHAVWIDPYVWMVLRFLCGYVLGGVFIVIESWFLLISPASKRSIALSIYILIYYISTSLGQNLLKWIDLHSFVPYAIAGVSSIIAMIPCFLVPVKSPAYDLSQKFSVITIIRASFKGFFGGFVSGILLACVYGLAPVYGQNIGLSVAEISTMMSIVIFGGLSLQLPLGSLADRTSRKWVMIGSCFLSAVFSGILAFFTGIPWAGWLGLIWLFGGFVFALYPLSMAFTCEKVTEGQVIAVAGGFNLIYGVGAVIGPLLVPLCMNWFGSAGFFYFISLVSLLMGFVGMLPSWKNFTFIQSRIKK